VLVDISEATKVLSVWIFYIFKGSGHLLDYLEEKKEEIVYYEKINFDNLNNELEL
jgi:hypothetical protein